MKLELSNRSPDESFDIYGSGAVALCATCNELMPKGYPLWGVHLEAAVALHAAHRAVKDLAGIPAPTDEDRRFGRGLVIGPKS